MGTRSSMSHGAYRSTSSLPYATVYVSCLSSSRIAVLNLLDMTCVDTEWPAWKTFQARHLHT